MKTALGVEGRAALAVVMQSRPLLAFDFDGTLAPIVVRPDEATVPIAVVRRLTQLAEHWPVAIVTGRSVDDVSARLGFSPTYIVGNHGIEDPADPQLLHWERTLDPMRRRIEANAEELHAAGVTIEDKRLSLALHYRLAPHRALAMAAIERVLDGPDNGVHRVGGKCVVNITAAGAPDKGDALASLARRCAAGAALYVGDDLNDEAAFAKAPPHWMTIRVGRDHTHSAARFYLDVPSHLPALLEAAIDHCRR